MYHWKDYNITNASPIPQHLADLAKNISNRVIKGYFVPHSNPDMAFVETNLLTSYVGQSSIFIEANLPVNDSTKLI